tara:strand:- start:71 stop:406 length:336 start_codon:yes stop_codon:yes gene_type:complete
MVADFNKMPIVSKYLNNFTSGQSFTLQLFDNVTYLSIVTSGGSILMFSSNSEYAGNLSSIEDQCILIASGGTYLFDIPVSYQRVGNSWLKFEHFSGGTTEINVAQICTAEV